MVILIVGEMGSGKTTMLKHKFLNRSNKQKLCYALMKQDIAGFKYERDFRKFVSQGVTKTDMLFVIDEAFTAIPKKEPDPTNPKKLFDKQLVTWFLNSRKSNNAIFIVFHGLSEIPVWLLRYTNFFLRFNTQDQLNFQKSRFTSFPTVVKSLIDYPTIPKYQYDEIVLRQ